MSLHAEPNDIHQADIFYLHNDKYKKKIYKYALNIVDVAIIVRSIDFGRVSPQ